MIFTGTTYQKLQAEERAIARQFHQYLLDHAYWFDEQPEVLGKALLIRNEICQEIHEMLGVCTDVRRKAARRRLIDGPFVGEEVEASKAHEYLDMLENLANDWWSAWERLCDHPDFEQEDYLSEKWS